MLLLCLSYFPRLQVHEEEACIGALHLRQEREIGDGYDARDPGRLQEGCGDLLFCSVGTLRRSSIGKLKSQEHVALVLGGDEPAGQPAAKVDRQDSNEHQTEHGKGGLVNQDARDVDEAIGCAAKESIESREPSFE